MIYEDVRQGIPNPSPYMINYQKHLLKDPNFVNKLYKEQPTTLPPLPTDPQPTEMAFGTDASCVGKWSICIVHNPFTAALTPHLVFVFNWSPTTTPGYAFVAGWGFDVFSSTVYFFQYNSVVYTGCP